MGIDIQKIEALLKQAFPDATVRADNMKNDGNHYVAHIDSEAFRDKSPLQRHQMVYEALEGYLGGKELHSLVFKTGLPGGYSPDEYTQYVAHVESKVFQDRTPLQPHHMIYQTLPEGYSVDEYIQNEIDQNDVVIFMKGVPECPQCGLSAHTVEVLRKMNIPFKGIDILQNMDLRQGIKKFSNWPTLPQVYVKGEFIGGRDIICEMFDTGDLHRLFTEKGLTPDEVGSEG